MTTDPGAVPPDANPLPELGEFVVDESGGGVVGGSGVAQSERDLDELDSLIKGERQSQQQSSPRPSSSLMQESSSSLMQEDNGQLDNNNGVGYNGNNNTNNGSSLPQSMATAAGAAVVGGAAIVAGGAVMGTAAAVAGMAPVKPDAMQRSSVPQQQSRGRRMCRRCQAFKPPRAHHCRYVLFAWMLAL